MADTWRQASNLVALDLEGSGAQDRGQEAILEIAAVRLVDGRPDETTAYATRVDPGRAIPARSWISPGLAGRVPVGTPTMAAVERELTGRLAGVYLVGHNVAVDWRLLRHRCPHIDITGLIDTYRLARAVRKTGKHGLAYLITHHHLAKNVAALAASSQPHRALWDTIGAALLLDALIQQHWTTDPSLAELLAVASPPAAEESPDAQATLFDLGHRQIVLPGTVDLTVFPT